MTEARRVYVFGCRELDILGFTLNESGSNLPPTPHSKTPWRPVGQTNMCQEGLQKFGVDALRAMKDLAAGGYFVGRQLGVVIPFRGRNDAN